MVALSDPRQYAIHYPDTNPIINKALQVKHGSLPVSELEESIRAILKNNNNVLINLAMSLSPDATTSRIIRKALDNAINVDSNTASNKVCLFAVPIVLVAGSKTRNKLPKQIDTDMINQFFWKNGIVNTDYDLFISGKLVDPQMIAKFNPSQIYYWVRNISNASLWLPVSIEGNGVVVENEGVFLRFLIGVACGSNSGINGIINFNNYYTSSMQFMELLVNELKVPGVTIFPIPYEPCYLSSSFTIADNYRKEIAISVALSNAIRKIRSSGLTPKIKIASELNAIKLSVYTVESLSFEESSLWYLTLFDDLEDILLKIVNLLRDLKVEYSI